jgi:hypothetical protein
MVVHHYRSPAVMLTHIEAPPFVSQISHAGPCFARVSLSFNVPYFSPLGKTIEDTFE